MSDPMSVDAVREARLRALGGGGRGEGGRAATDFSDLPSSSSSTTRMATDGDASTAAAGADGMRMTPPPPSPPPPIPSFSSASSLVASPASSPQRGGVRKGKMMDSELASIRELMWPTSVTEDDLNRWHQQGFVFQESPPFGLVQGHGGPCGVLAAVQAEILRISIFGSNSSKSTTAATGLSQLPTPSSSELTSTLAEALLTILIRALPPSSSSSPDEMMVIAPPPPSTSNTPGAISIVTTSELPCSITTTAASLSVHTFSDIEEGRSFLTSSDALEAFQSPSGVMLFVYSILISRGARQTKRDMDDPGNTLTGQFGHCAQELLNLLLIGQAVSNVFDGDRELGDSGLILKGIGHRPSVGYLTHLEALRYVQVGSHFKTPLYPVWVIGSTSHFTVLFSLDKGCNEESEGEQLLSRVQRAFKVYDPSEGGFIEVINLRQVLIELDLLSVALDDGAYDQLKTKLEVPGAGIVLWDDFWQAVSRLMTGVALKDLGSDTAITTANGYSSTAVGGQGGADFDSVNPHLIGLHPPATTTTITAMDVEGGGNPGGETRQRSDSDFARELQAQFDAGEGGGVPDLDDDEDASSVMAVASMSGPPALLGEDQLGLNTSPIAESSSLSPPLSSHAAEGGRPRSDSDIAREMQAKFDQELDLASPYPAHHPAPPPSPTSASSTALPQISQASTTSLQAPLGEEGGGSGSASAQGGLSSSSSFLPPLPPPSASLQDPSRHTLYHYNGLAGPGGRTSRLAKFSLMKRPGQADRMLVGHSVAFGTSPMGTGSAFSCPIEEVLATKWPGARFNWHGERPPSID